MTEDDQFTKDGYPLRWLSRKQSAIYLGVSFPSLANAAVDGLLYGRPAPKYRKYGKLVRYSRQELDHWIESAPEGRTAHEIREQLA